MNIKLKHKEVLGAENELDDDDVKDADVVILAVSIVIEGEDRFDGKPILRVPVDRAIKDTANLVDEAVLLTK